MKFNSYLGAIILSTTILFLASFTVIAQVPQLLNYQGRIAVNGTNFTGTGQFKFALISTSTNASVQATATGTVSYGFLVFIAVNNGGSGYTTPPAVIITDSTGTNASAYAQISGGVVTNIVVNSAGSGYSASPVITITAPPQQNVSTTFWSNDGTSNAGGQPATSVPLPVTKGLYSVLLGDTTLSNMASLPASVFANSGVWLRVWFNDGPTGFQQLTPDQRLASVAYAVIAGTAQTVADGSITANKIALGAVGTAQLAPGAGGTMTFQTTSSTNLQAISNYGYVFTNGGLNTVTLPATPMVGDQVRVSGISDGLKIIANIGQSIIAPPSFELIPRGISNTWASISCSGDGSMLIAATYSGYTTIPATFLCLYTSSDYGVTWIARTNSGINNCLCVAGSSDGSHLIAGEYVGSIVTSSDYGVTWTRQTNVTTNGLWGSVACSSDGSHLVASSLSIGYIYISSDYGATWSPQIDLGINIWNCVACSSDGSHLIAGGADYFGYYGQYAVSTNYGATWTVTVNTNENADWWQSVASSSDGSHLIAASVGYYEGYGYLSTSSDYGVTWIARTNSGLNNWYCVASSSDGSHLIAGTSGGYLYISTDYGVTWRPQLNAGVRNWVSVTSSGDGSRMFAATSNGFIYPLPDFKTQWSTVYVFGSAYANMELIYAGGGLWIPVSYSGTFTIK